MKRNRKIIYLAGFLFSIPIALTSYINSSFLKTYFSNSYLSIIYVIASALSILLMLGLPVILNKLGNRKFSLYLITLSFSSFLMLAFSANEAMAIFAFILNFICINFLIATLDIFVEDFSKNKTIGKFRGLYLTIINIAWVIAQAISGSIISKSSFKGIYLLSALFMVLTSLVFIFLLRDFKDPHYKKISVWKTIKYFIRNKRVSKIYLINLILKFFFAWMVIYTPVYLNHNLGFTWDKIGLMFTIMLTPFVILSYPLGKLSDKIGEKKMLIYGFIISTTATLSIPFITEPFFWTWALVLFMSRVGAATIEIMSESYFFKIENEENADAISFFRNTQPLSYMIAPLLATFVFFFIPSFEYIFYILGAILLIGLSITLKIKDVK